jgi:hypothetical protein
MSKAKSHIIQVPIYLYVDVTDAELRNIDIDFIVEKKVIDKYKTFDGELHLSTDLLMFDDWDIYETEYEVES